MKKLNISKLIVVLVLVGTIIFASSVDEDLLSETIALIILAGGISSPLIAIIAYSVSNYKKTGHIIPKPKNVKDLNLDEIEEEINIYYKPSSYSKRSLMVDQRYQELSERKKHLENKAIEQMKAEHLKVLSLGKSNPSNHDPFKSSERISPDPTLDNK